MQDLVPSRRSYINPQIVDAEGNPAVLIPTAIESKTNNVSISIAIRVASMVVLASVGDYLTYKFFNAPISEYFQDGYNLFALSIGIIAAFANVRAVEGEAIKDWTHKREAIEIGVFSTVAPLLSGLAIEIVHLYLV